jgi:hypothetical protein
MDTIVTHSRNCVKPAETSHEWTKKCPMDAPGLWNLSNSPVMQLMNQSMELTGKCGATEENDATSCITVPDQDASSMRKATRQCLTLSWPLNLYLQFFTQQISIRETDYDQRRLFETEWERKIRSGTNSSQFPRQLASRNDWITFAYDSNWVWYGQHLGSTERRAVSPHQT